MAELPSWGSNKKGGEKATPPPSREEFPDVLLREGPPL